ncbi:MAG: ATP-binding protein [Prevotellaceae bacterium]|nr:ATP-binding protein [Prevotellaceae bacterium]
MTDVLNPFITSGYVSQEYFCDREDEVKRLIKNINNGNNTTLISTRRMGKSGLIMHCFGQSSIKKNYTVFFVDIYATKSLNDFVLLLSKSICEQLKSSGRKILDSFLFSIRSLRPEISLDAIGQPSISLNAGNIKRPEASLDEIFGFLNSSAKPCIVAIDEFQQIIKYPKVNTEALLRTYIQKSPHTRFIFSGSREHIMGEMFNSAKRPFFASTSTIYLDAIAKRKYIEFAQENFKKGGKKITADTVERIYDLFEGVTWYIQKVLNMLYGETARGKSCTVDSVDNAVKMIVDSNRYVYSENMFRLPDKQGKLLIAIAKEGKVTSPTSSDFITRYALLSASSAQSALGGLIEKEFVTRDENGYRTYDMFFEKWLKEAF